MNLSRAYSLAYDDELSVGRVQTPTLAMVVERELAIRAFVPEDYLEVVATFSPERRPRGGAEHVRGDLVRGPQAASGRRRHSRSQAAARRRRGGRGAIVERARRGDARDRRRSSRETRRMPPPQLYDLTELQRHANRLYGLSAQRTLDIAQSLYERHKLLSYPRTDSRHLSPTVAATLAAVVGAMSAPLPRPARRRRRHAARWASASSTTRR